MSKLYAINRIKASILIIATKKPRRAFWLFSVTRYNYPTPVIKLRKFRLSLKNEQRNEFLCLLIQLLRL